MSRNLRLISVCAFAGAMLAAPALAVADDPQCFQGPPGTDYTKPYEAPAALCPGPQGIRGLPEDKALPVEVLSRDKVAVQKDPRIAELLKRLEAPQPEAAPARKNEPAAK